MKFLSLSIYFRDFREIILERPKLWAKLRVLENSSFEHCSKDLGLSTKSRTLRAREI